MAVTTLHIIPTNPCGWLRRLTRAAKKGVIESGLCLGHRAPLGRGRVKMPLYRHLSPRTARRLFRLLLKPRQAGERLGADIPSELRAARRGGALRPPKEVQTMLVFYDEVVSIYLSLVLLMLVSTMSNRRRSTKQQLAGCLVALSRLATDAMAIRTLVVGGFEVQARSLATNLGESAELLAGLVLNPEIASEFYDAKEPEEAREFWHRHVSKGRLRNRIRDHQRERGVPEDAILEFSAWLSEERLVWGASKHPSFMSGLQSILPSLGTVEEDFALLGIVSPHSTRTLTYGIIILMEALGIVREPLLAMVPRRSRAFSAVSGKEFVEHVERGFLAVVLLAHEFEVLGKKSKSWLPQASKEPRSRKGRLP